MAAAAVLCSCAAAQPMPRQADPAASTQVATCVTDPRAVSEYQITEQAAAPLAAPLVKTLDEAATAALMQTASSGAVVAVQGPQGRWVESYGVADPATQKPMDSGMFQRIGSVSKTFAGTLVLQLAESERLDLEDTIGQFVPGVPNGDKVTLRMLLNMTSGIASYTFDENFTEQLFADPLKTWTPGQLIDIGLALPALFEPGAEFNYSNTNTLLLGKVIEKATGQPYVQVLNEKIIGPLKLGGTSMPGTTDPFPLPHAEGFTRQGTAEHEMKPVNATSWNPTWAWTAGQIVSTVDDLLVYGRALGTGQGLLKADTQVERLSSVPGSAGYGLALGCIDGWVGHTGELPGYNTSVFYNTATDTTVVVMANSDIPSGACAESKTLSGNTGTLPCMDPAVRIFNSVSLALGHEFVPNPKK